MTTEKALQKVYYLAERKHQDECYEKTCDYCLALGTLALNFPITLADNRVEGYVEYVKALDK